MTAGAAPGGSPVPRRTIGRFDRVVINGVEYRGETSDEVGHELVRTDETAIPETLTHEQYDRARGSIGFRYDRNWFEPGKVRARFLAGVASLTHLLPTERSQILWRLEWCKAVLKDIDAGDGSRSDDGLRRIIHRHSGRIAMLDYVRLAEVSGSTGPHRNGGTEAPKITSRAGRKLKVRCAPAPKALRTWVTRLEDGGFDPLALRTRTYRSGYRRIYFDPEIHLALQTVACRYATRTRPQKARLHEDLLIVVGEINQKRAAKGLPSLACPSRKTLSKVIAKLDKFEVYAGRFGAEAARRRFQMVSAGPDVTLPFERIEMDEWTVSLQKLAVEAGLWEQMPVELRKKVERVRYALCVAIDVATKCTVGASMRPTACVENAMATLHMAVIDKSTYARAAGAHTPWDMYAGVGTLVTDTGSSFISEVFQGAAITIGADPFMPPTGLPHLRGHVERSFGSLRTRLASRFTGQTFENVVAKGDYDPVFDASLSVEEWAQVLVRHWVDHYHNWPHEGLGGDTPRNRWLELNRSYRTAEPPDRNLLRETFGIPLRRTIGGHGVQVLGLHYNAKRLQAFFRNAGPVELDVRVDPRDLGYASVLVEGGWLTLRCHREGFDGVTVDAWMRAAGDLRRRYSDKAKVTLSIALAAIRDIQAISDAAVARAGIAALTPLPGELDRLERQMEFGFELPLDLTDPDDPAHSGTDEDPLDGGYVTGGTGADEVARTEPSPPPTQPGAPPKGRRFKMSGK